MSINVDDTPSKKMKLLERENEGLTKQLTEKKQEIDYLKEQVGLEAEDRLAKSIFFPNKHCILFITYFYIV